MRNIELFFRRNNSLLISLEIFLMDVKTLILQIRISYTKEMLFILELLSKEFLSPNI